MRRVTLLVLTAFVSALVLVPAPAEAATHDQTVFAFGSATFKGSTQGFPLARPIVAMANTANGSGYWLIGGHGGVISFGAPFYGSLAMFRLSADIVNMAATPSGKGYWMVGADGYVYPFGDAVWYGGMSNV